MSNFEIYVLLDFHEFESWIHDSDRCLDGRIGSRLSKWKLYIYICHTIYWLIDVGWIWLEIFCLPSACSTCQGPVTTAALQHFFILHRRMWGKWDGWIFRLSREDREREWCLWSKLQWWKRLEFHWMIFDYVRRHILIHPGSRAARDVAVPGVRRCKLSRAQRRAKTVMVQNAIKRTKVEQMVPAYTVPVSLCIVMFSIEKQLLFLIIDYICASCV